MLSSQQLHETNNAIKQCYSKLPIYHKLDPVKKIQFLSTIWNPHHLIKPTRYTPLISHLHLRAAKLSDTTIPPNPPTSSSAIFPLSLLSNPTHQQLQTIQQSRKDAISYQGQVVEESGVCPEFIELHIFWLQASVDLFLQCDIGYKSIQDSKSTKVESDSSTTSPNESPSQFTSSQLLFRLYDQIVRYISAIPYTQSDITNNGTNMYSEQFGSPSCIQFIPYPYIQDILTDFFTSPSFLASFDLLLPTYRSTLLTPPSQTAKKYHNIYTLLYVLCFEEKKLFSSQILTQITGSILTAFPTLLTGFIYVATHSGVDIQTIGQLLIDIYLVRGYKQQVLQEQQHIDLSIEQLFQRWTKIVLQNAISKNSNVAEKISQTPRKQRPNGKVGSTVLNRLDQYNKLSTGWSSLVQLRHNILRSVLDLHSIDQIADKVMRKQQFLTKKKQVEFSERIKNQFGSSPSLNDIEHNGFDTRLDFHGKGDFAEYPGSSASSSDVVFFDDDHNRVEKPSSQHKINHSPNQQNKSFQLLEVGSTGRDLSPAKVPHLTIGIDYPLDNDNDNDSRGGDFDGIDMDFNTDSHFDDEDQGKDQHQHNIPSALLTPKQTNTKPPKKFTTPQKLQPLQPNSILQPNQPQTAFNSFHLNSLSPNNNIDDSQFLPSTKQTPKPSPNIQTIQSSPQKLLFHVPQCDEYDIDEIKTFREVDNTLFYKATAFPRYTNSQTYLLQLTAQKPDLVYDIKTMIQEFDTFQISIAIDEDGQTMVSIIPPKRHKVIEMNDDDHEYVQQQRIKYQKEQQMKKHAQLIASGKLTPEQIFDLQQHSSHQLNESHIGIGLDMFSDTQSFDNTVRSKTTFLQQQNPLQSGVFGQGGPRSILGATQIQLGSTMLSPGFHSNTGFGDSLSLFSGRSGITLGGNVSTAMKSIMLSSITSTNTLKSLLSPASLHRFGNVSQSPTLSFGFLASPTPISPPSSPSNSHQHNTNASIFHQPPQSPTNANTKTNASSRSNQFSLSQHNVQSQHSQPQNSHSQNNQQNVFIQTMQIFHKNRLTRKYNTFIHPQQQFLVNLFENQNDRQNSITPTEPTETGPWSLLPIEGEGLSEWNPLETHYFLIIIRLLPLYPILITYASGFYSYSASFHQMSVYSSWAKLLFYLFGHRIGRREFIIDCNGGSISQYIQKKQYSTVSDLFKEEILLLSQMLFVIGTTLHNSLLSYDDKYGTLNLGWIYMENDLIDSSSLDYHDESMYPNSINNSVIFTHGGYIHSIRSLYSLLKYVMIKLKQILHCVGEMEQKQLNEDIAHYNQSIQYQSTQNSAKLSSHPDLFDTSLLQADLHEHSDKTSADTLPTILVTQQDIPIPITPQTPDHPKLLEIVANIQSHSFLTKSRGEVEEILFQAYFLYQRHFAYSTLSLPAKGQSYQHHQRIASKLTPNSHSYQQYKIKKEQNPKDTIEIPLPSIDWTTSNNETSTRSQLLLFPQNNIVAIQTQLHKQLLLLPSPTTSTSPSLKDTSASSQPQLAPSIVFPLKSTKSTPLPNLSSSLISPSTLPSIPPTSTEDDMRKSSSTITLTQASRTMEITPEMERKIHAVDRILSHIFPHYSPIQTSQDQSTHQRSQILPKPPQPLSSPNKLNIEQQQSLNSFTTYSVNRLWIDFDLLYDFYTLARLLQIDLLLIDGDKKKLCNSKATKSSSMTSNINPLAPSHKRQEFILEMDSLEGIVPYYLDIFNSTLLCTDPSTPLNKFNIDCDGTITLASITDNDVLINEKAAKGNTNKKGQPLDSTTHRSDDMNSMDHDDNTDEEFDDDIDAITRGRQTGVSSQLDPSSTTPGKHKSRTYDDYDSTQRRTFNNNNLTSSPTHIRNPTRLNADLKQDQQSYSFRYDPDGDTEDSTLDDQSSKPQLRHTQSQINLNNSSPYHTNITIASKPMIDDFQQYDKEYDAVLIVPRKLIRDASSELIDGNEPTLSVTNSSSSVKSQMELDYESNRKFRAIQRGEADLMLFEYLKPTDVSTMYEYIVENYYTDNGVSPVIVHKYSSGYEPKEALSTFSPTPDSDEPSSTKPKKKRWFKF